MSKKFIQKALAGGRGKLHKNLGIPQGEKIPAARLAAAAKEKGTVGREARFAQTLAKLRKK